MFCFSFSLSFTCIGTAVQRKLTDRKLRWRWNSNSGTRFRFHGRATIPLGRNIAQVVYTYCLRSFSKKRGYKKGVFGA